MTRYLLALHAPGECPDVPFEEWKQSFAGCGAVTGERDIGTGLAAFPK